MNAKLGRRIVISRFNNSVIQTSPDATSAAGFYLDNAATDQPPATAVERLVSTSLNGRLLRSDVRPQHILTHPIPSREPARLALSDPMCRCGTLKSNLNGVLRAAELI